MMNGELVKDAVSIKSGSHLGDLLSGKGNDVQKLQRLYLTSLGRMPTRPELSSAQRYLKGSRDQLAVYLLGPAQLERVHFQSLTPADFIRLIPPAP
jgi:hypothetical protein